MAMVYCHECGRYVDDDWHPCEEHNGELICPDCAEQLEEDDDE